MIQQLRVFVTFVKDLEFRYQHTYQVAYEHL